MATKLLGQIGVFYEGTTAPSNTKMVWLDTSVSPRVFRVYNTGSNTWKPLTTESTVQTTLGGSTTITSDTKNFLSSSGLTSALTLPNPTGTPTQGQVIKMRLEDNGTPRAITWSGSQWRAMGVTLPTTTISTKVMYIEAIWDSVDSKWDVISLINQA